jgi:hypothetical protein
MLLLLLVSYVFNAVVVPSPTTLLFLAVSLVRRVLTLFKAAVWAQPLALHALPVNTSACLALLLACCALVVSTRMSLVQLSVLPAKPANTLPLSAALFVLPVMMVMFLAEVRLSVPPAAKANTPSLASPSAPSAWPVTTKIKLLLLSVKTVPLVHTKQPLIKRVALPALRVPSPTALHQPLVLSALPVLSHLLAPSVLLSVPTAVLVSSPVPLLKKLVNLVLLVLINPTLLLLLVVLVWLVSSPTTKVRPSARPATLDTSRLPTPSLVTLAPLVVTPRQQIPAPARTVLLALSPMRPLRSTAKLAVWVNSPLPLPASLVFHVVSVALPTCLA